MSVHVVKIFSVLFLFFLFGGSVTGQLKLTLQEYGVYAAVLKDIYKYNRETYSNKSHFVLLNQTKVSDELSTPSKKKYGGLIRNFEKRNLVSASIEKSLPNGDYSQTYYLISQAEIDELFKEGKIEYDKQKQTEKLQGKMVVDVCGSSHWKPFYRHFPDASGYYNLSRVGFTKLYAMVQVEGKDVCNGFSRTYILKKNGRGWKIFIIMGSEWVA